MSKEKERDYLCLFRSKFDVMLKLSNIGLREMTQAMYDFLEGKEPVFSDSQAQALWWTWSLEFNTAKENYKNKCEKNKQRARERWEQNKVGIENMPTHANACERIPTHANAYTGIEKMPTHANDAYTETDTETETETETDNIFIENKNIYNNAPTKDKILKLAKDPSVALSPEEAEKFYDHYTAQSWTRSNGQAIANTTQALVSMLRMWKSNSGNFAPRQQTFSYGNQQPQKSRRERIDETIRNNRDCFIELFRLVDTHQLGEYDNDPKTWDEWSYRENVLDKIEKEGFSPHFKIYAKYRKEN